MPDGRSASRARSALPGIPRDAWERAGRTYFEEILCTGFTNQESFYWSHYCSFWVCSATAGWPKPRRWPRPRSRFSTSTSTVQAANTPMSPPAQRSASPSTTPSKMANAPIAPCKCRSACSMTAPPPAPMMASPQTVQWTAALPSPWSRRWSRGSTLWPTIKPTPLPVTTP